MAISWTLIVFGTLLQGMQCNANDVSTTASVGTTSPTTVDTTTADSTKTTVPPITSSSTKPTISAHSLESTTLATTLTSLEPNKSATPPAPSESTTLASSKPTKPGTPSSSPGSTAPPTTKATSTELTVPSSTVAKQDLASNSSSPNGLVTTQITTFNNSPQNSPTTVITTVPNQVTNNLNKAATTDGTTQLLSTQTNPSAFATNSALPSTAASGSKSTASQSFGTTKAQTTTATITPSLPNAKNITTSIPTLQKTFHYSFDLSSSTEGDIVYQACKVLGQNMKGNCSVTLKIYDKQLIATVIINEPVSAVTDKNTFQKGNVNKDTISDTLIAILASCGALVLILCCFAAYCTYHRRSYRKNQQHLTEELQTVENGYHDNPTLEVMEVQPEMQEKKLTMNGEFNDSWIVPIDNLLKEDIPDEEDTHL